MSQHKIPTWWERLGCMRNPGAHSGEEQARDLEIAALRSRVEELEKVAHAELTPMFLLNAALIIEDIVPVKQEKKDQILAKLHRIADELHERSNSAGDHHG